VFEKEQEGRGEGRGKSDGDHKTPKIREREGSHEEGRKVSEEVGKKERKEGKRKESKQDTRRKEEHGKNINSSRVKRKRIGRTFSGKRKSIRQAVKLGGSSKWIRLRECVR